MRTLLLDVTLLSTNLALLELLALLCLGCIVVARYTGISVHLCKVAHMALDLRILLLLLIFPVCFLLLAWRSGRRGGYMVG